MTVFKTYFKIVKQFLPTIIMYFCIFLFIAIMFSTSSSTNMTFSSVQPKVAIVNHDDSMLSHAFVEYVKKQSKIIVLSDTEESYKDALFYREVDCIIEIPKNYSRDSQEEKEVSILFDAVPNSVNGEYAKMVFNRYLNLYQFYLESGIEEAEIASMVSTDLEQNAKVSLQSEAKKDIDKVNSFYNYMNYTILAVSILVIAMITNEFTERKLKRRNVISSTSYRKINRQLLLGNCCFTFILWLSYAIVSFIMYGDTMLSLNGAFFLLNSFVFSIMALSLGFLIGNCVRNREAQNGIVNIIALGSSFLCGAFVPQEMLGAVVLSVSRILPSYWFITGNNEIASISHWNIETILPILVSMGIILIFACLFFAMSNIFTHFRLKEE